MLDLGTVRKTLLRHQPSLEEPPPGTGTEAAVALVLHEPAGRPPEILFIERALREGDPWSGHMAFPGGRRDAGDRDLQETAARETLEEVGVELGPPLGRLDDFSGARVRPILVAPFVYEVPERPPLELSHEVNDAVWVPVDWILDPRSTVAYRHERSPGGESYPALRYRRFTVWGLTYRVLRNFFEILDLSLD